MKWPSGDYVAPAYAVCIAVLVTVGVVGFRSTVGFVDRARWQRHTYQVLSTLETLLAATIDSETAGRGFALTGQDAYLDPYGKAQKEIPSLVSELRDLTRDNAGQQYRLTELERLINERLALSGQVISARQAGGVDAAARTVATMHGKQIMDRVRSVIAEMKSEEDDLLVQRDEETKRAGRVTTINIIAGSALAVLLVALSGATVYRQNARRRRAEDLRRRAEADRDRFFALSLDMHCTVSMDGHFLVINPAFERILGFTPDEILAATDTEIIHPDDIEKTRDVVRRLSHGQEIRQFENRFRCRDGSYHWLSWRAIPDTEHAVLYATARDVTARKLAEDALRRSEEDYRLLAENSSDVITRRTPDGAYRYVSPRIRGLLGYDPGEIEGKSPLEFCHPDDVEAIRALNAKVLTHDGVETCEYRFRRRDGTYAWLEATAHAVRDADTGEVTEIIASSRGITARKEREAEVERLNSELRNQTIALEAVNKELEAFAYSVSHDLRAPLRSIDGFSHALLDDYGNALDDVGQDFLRRIRAASQRMAAMIDDLLSLSRLTRRELTVDDVDLSAMARDIAQELNDANPQRPVEWVIDPALSDIADPHLMRHVLQNLLGNAWKYSRNKEAARIEFGSLPNNGHRKYYVRDNGAGFDMRYAGKLFGAFQRLHSVEEFDGVGVGLATVKRIVQRFGGDVWAEGEVNRGATFYFTLHTKGVHDR